MSRPENNFIKYILELLIVAFGVMLGMYVSDWNAQKKTKNQVKKTLVYIQEEIEGNIKGLTKAVAYHEELKLTVDSMRSEWKEKNFLQPYFSNDFFRIAKIPGWEGPGMVAMENSVFEGARMTNILQEIDIEHLRIITKAYKAQENYEVISKGVMEKIFSLDSESKVVDAVGFLELIIYDIRGNEKFLLKHLEESLERIKELN